MAALQVQIAVPQGVESPAQPPAAVAFSPRRERDSPGAPAKFRSIPAEAVAASPGRPGPGTEVPPAAGTEAAPDADSLRRYRWALALAAHELRPHHDELALAAGATVDLRVEHDARGLARAITVRQSSGHAATDSSARALVARAVDRVVLPVSLRGRAFAVDVSIDVRADE
ncbi:MAG: hypothetical protein KF778_19530 [Rhodocyclaceae bacterium]|nr:hypothetical protein [Rhodocyclaceae bacterium]